MKPMAVGIQSIMPSLDAVPAQGASTQGRVTPVDHPDVVFNAIVVDRIARQEGAGSGDVDRGSSHWWANRVPGPVGEFRDGHIDGVFIVSRPIPLDVDDRKTHK